MEGNLKIQNLLTQRSLYKEFTLKIGLQQYRIAYAKDWKQPKCLYIGKWLSKLWNTHKKESYVPIF